MTKELYEKYKKALENNKLPPIFKKLFENAVKEYEKKLNAK